MTENIDPKTEQYLYDIVQFENAINAAGWTIIRIGLFKRFLCHATTGVILSRYYGEPVDDLDDLQNLLEQIEEHNLRTQR